jgi:crooked neck
VQPAGGFEEYFDYIFPDEDAGQGNLKLLQMAHMWKQKQQQPAEAEAPAPAE